MSALPRRLLLLGLVALPLAACGKKGDPELRPIPQPPGPDGKPQPPKPNPVKPGSKPMMENGKFLLDPLL